MDTFMNHEFAIGFAKHATLLGIDRRQKDGGPLFSTILRNEPTIKHIGGRSAGSHAAIDAVSGKDGKGVTHLIILSFPFSTTYSSSDARSLKKNSEGCEDSVYYGGKR